MSRIQYKVVQMRDTERDIKDHHSLLFFSFLFSIEFYTVYARCRLYGGRGVTMIRTTIVHLVDGSPSDAQTDTDIH
jgi:hypothetical protein